MLKTGPPGADLMSPRVRFRITLPSIMRCLLILLVTMAVALAALPALPAYRQKSMFLNGQRYGLLS